MPKTADKFNVQSDITLVFESNGKNYQMRLIISSGLIMLSEVGSKEDERIIFIDDSSHYTGEEVTTEVTEEVSLVEEEKPKKKRKRSKKKEINVG
jgi:hypothetical protein